MNTLLVVPNFRSFEPKLKEEGEYLLVLPQAKSCLWGHFCSSVRWAFYDLTCCLRGKILDQLFGKNNYELELYKFTDIESFNEYCEKINKSNKQIDLDKLRKLKDKYGE